MIDVHLLPHAIDRYVDRVKPHLERAAAKAELERLIRMAEGEPVPRPHLNEGDAALELAPGIWLALAKSRRFTWVGCTVLTNSETSKEQRAAKNARKARLRASRKARREKGTRNKVPTAHAGHRYSRRDAAA